MKNGCFVHNKGGKVEHFSRYLYQNLWKYLLGLSHRLARVNFFVSVSWFICLVRSLKKDILSVTKLAKSLSFQDIFTKIVGHHGLGLFYRLTKLKLKFFVFVSVCWFICSLKQTNGYFVPNKNGKVTYFQDIFTKNSGHLGPDQSHRLAKVTFLIFVWVSISWLICSLKINKIYIFSITNLGKLLNFQDIFTKIGGIPHMLIYVKLNFFLCVCQLI